MIDTELIAKNLPMGKGASIRWYSTIDDEFQQEYIQKDAQRRIEQLERNRPPEKIVKKEIEETNEEDFKIFEKWFEETKNTDNTKLEIYQLLATNRDVYIAEFDVYNYNDLPYKTHIYIVNKRKSPKRDYRSFKKMELEVGYLKSLKDTKAITPSRKEWVKSLIPTFPELQEPLEKTQRSLICKIDKQYIPTVNKQGLNRRFATYEELNEAMVSPDLTQIQRKIIDVLYAVVWDSYENNLSIDLIQISAIELTELVGYSKTPNIKNRDIENVVATLEFFAVTGCYFGAIFDKETKAPSLHPLLFVAQYDRENGVVSFGSPYFAELVRTMVKENVLRDKQGYVKYKKNGLPHTRALNKYMKRSLYKRNTVVFDFVSDIVQIVKTAPEGQAHFKLMTIVETNQAIYKAFSQYKRPIDFFKKFLPLVFQALRDDTYLIKEYPEINIPDWNNPTHRPLSKNYKTIVYRLFAKDVVEVK